MQKYSLYSWFSKGGHLVPPTFLRILRPPPSEGKKKDIFLAQIVTELEYFEDKENLWKLCIKNIWKI